MLPETQPCFKTYSEKGGNWAVIPYDVWLLIFHYFNSVQDLLSVGKVCQMFSLASSCNILWETPLRELKELIVETAYHFAFDRWPDIEHDLHQRAIFGPQGLPPAASFAMNPVMLQDPYSSSTSSSTSSFSAAPKFFPPVPPDLIYFPASPFSVAPATRNAASSYYPPEYSLKGEYVELRKEVYLQERRKRRRLRFMAKRRRLQRHFNSNKKVKI